VSAGRGLPEPGRDEVVFRSLSAPGLEEDDLLSAVHGGALWGDGRPPLASRASGRPGDPAAERRRRHQGLLRKWRPASTPERDGRARES
jgi:hypothetical protein